MADGNPGEDASREDAEKDAESLIVQRVPSMVGIVRLLQDRIGKNAISSALNSLLGGTTVTLLFEYNAIILKGTSQADVEKAHDYINSTYLGNLCYDLLEINESDLRLRVSEPGDLRTDLIQPIEKAFECVIEARPKGWKSLNTIVAGRKSTHTKKDECSKVMAVEGDLTKYRADVLVNAVLFETSDLSKNGPLSKIFSTAGGPQLKEAYSKVKVPTEFGEDVAVTPASGSLRAKKIYHAALRPFQDEKSAELLYELIHKCLEMAKADGLRTIAFPALGCGRLGFNAEDVANIFMRAARITGGLQVFVVSFEKRVYEIFKLAASNTVCSIVFHINTFSSDTMKAVREELKCRTMSLPVTSEIVHSVVGQLTKTAIKDLDKLKSADTQIDIDKANGRVIIKAPSQEIDATRAAILQILDAEKRRLADPAHIKKTKGITEYLKLLASDTDPVTLPAYWTGHAVAARAVLPKGISKFDNGLRVVVDTASAIYNEINMLFTKACDPMLIGQGTDAIGIKYKSFAMKNAWRIENPRIYKRFISKRKDMCLSASVQAFPSVNGLDGETEIKTRVLGIRELEKDTVSEVNEYVLFHGTKKESVDVIMNQGLDSRMTTKALYGNGTYFSESATKADQYADSMNARSPNGHALYMYIVRVLLGHPYVARQPYAYCRPPCKQAGCTGQDRCAKHSTICDSVIGTHRTNNQGPLLFREFVAYHSDQCYPEYLVEYVRV